MEKLEGWKGSLLNQAEKKVMIKAVVQVIPSYVMCTLTLPKTLCFDRITSVVRFWWAKTGKHRGIYWKNVNILCSPKEVGGLGFREFNKMNTAQLAKQAWRIIQDPQSYWASTLKSIYFPNSEFWNAKDSRSSFGFGRAFSMGAKFSKNQVDGPLDQTLM